jgi:acetyltransferase-like isoleucine patch superfamily enzyme
MLINILDFIYRILFKAHVMAKNRYYYKWIGNNGSKDYSLGVNVFISNPKNMFIGSNTYINGGEFVCNFEKIIIGNNCLLADKLHLRTDSHNYLNKTYLISSQKNFSKPIIIQDDVWIGYGVQILPGVTIKKGCVIGAGSIVTKDTEEFYVYAGVPAKKIKQRF